MHMKKLILGLFLVFSCNVLSAEKTKIQIAKDYITANLKQVVASTTNNAYVKKATEVYNKYPLAISAALFSLYDVVCKDGNAAKISAIIANCASTYGAPIVMQYCQEIGLVDKEVSLGASPNDVLVKYHLLNYLIGAGFYKLVNAVSQSSIQFVSKR